MARHSRALWLLAGALAAQVVVALVVWLPYSTKIAVLVLLPLQAGALWSVWRRERSLTNRANDAVRRMRSLVEASREWLWSTDADGRLIEVGSGSGELLGYTAEDLIGVSGWHLLAGKGEVHRLREESAVAIETGLGWHRVVSCLRHADGRDVWVETTAIPVFDANGRLLAFDGMCRPAEGAGGTAAQRQLVAQVGAVISGSAFVCAFQPIVDLSQGRITGVEALSRFHDGQSPEVWFSHAARAGLLLELELAAVREALDSAQVVPHDLYVSVNVSPATIADPRLVDVLEAAPLPFDRVVLEITEQVSVEDYEELAEPLTRLRQRGARLAVDDAGAGYASFRHILRLRPDVIKLDRALVHDMHVEPGARALVAAIVMFALEVGSTVVAEGIETVEELSAAAVLGIDAVQGFALAKPSTNRSVWDRWFSGLGVTLLASSGRLVPPAVQPPSPTSAVL